MRIYDLRFTIYALLAVVALQRAAGVSSTLRSAATEDGPAVIGPPQHAVTWNAVTPCDHYEVQTSINLGPWQPYDYPTNNFSFIAFSYSVQLFRARAWNGIVPGDWATSN